MQQGRFSKPPFLLTNEINEMTQILYKQRSFIKKGETIRGMGNVSPLATMKFYNQSSEHILNKYFPDADYLQQKNSNLILDAIDEAKNGYDFKRYDFFSDKNRDSKINTDEELIFKLLLFVSADGNKVKECYEVVKPADDEIILFLETDSDSLSGQKLFGRVSEKIRKTYVNTSTGKLYSSFFDGNIMDTVQKYLSKINKPIIEELFINGHITDKSISVDFFSGLRYLLLALSAPTKALGWVMNKIGDGIDFLKIPDEFWDTENENYSFNKENIIENLSISTDKLAILKNLFKDKKGFDLADITPKMLDDIILNQLAVIESFVGKYNSYVKTEIEDIFKRLELPGMEIATDSIAQPIALICGVWNGLVDFVSSIIKFIGMLLEAPFDISKDFQQILEMIDNFWDGLRDGSVWKNLKNAVDGGMKDMVEYLKSKNTDDINWVRIYYLSGFTISFAATFFIPVANTAKLANLGKAGDILAEIQKSLFQTAKFVKVQTAEAYQTASKALMNLFELIKVGGQKLQNFVRDIWKKIVEWFVKNKESIKGWNNKIKEAFNKEGKTEEFFRKIEKKFNLARQEILSANDIKTLRRSLKETFDVTLEFVDQNPALKAKLKDWTSRRVAGSFNMVEGVMYLRKSVTAYTVQHEMFHMKLWYKMTKEFPELQALFQKTLGRENRLFHEEYVLAEFMKNPSKWDDGDLLNDLKIVNELRGKKRLPEVDLKYYKKWNLEQELLKFK